MPGEPAGTTVTEIGTVRVTESFAVERYSHVMHIVSEVTGTLKPGLSYADVLRATFPAGTVTGAPSERVGPPSASSIQTLASTLRTPSTKRTTA